MKLALSNHANISNFDGADFPEFACKCGYSKLFSGLSSFSQIFKIGGGEPWPLINRSTAHSRPRPPDGREIGEREGGSGSGRGATCRRRGAAVELGVDGG